MNNRKYYIALNDCEYAAVLASLIGEHNLLIQRGKYTDGVDDVILKLKKAKRKKFRILYR